MTEHPQTGATRLLLSFVIGPASNRPRLGIGNRGMCECGPGRKHNCLDVDVKQRGRRLRLWHLAVGAEILTADGVEGA